MITLRVPVTQETLDRLQEYLDTRRRDPETVAGHLLATASAHWPRDGRAVVLSGAVLDRLEAILGGGSILSPADALQKVERLAGISFFHVRLPFTPNQLEALAEKAARQGLTTEQLIERTAPRVYEQFFDLLTRV